MSIETWTTERVEQLQSFVVAGMSCSQIAAQIGVTRNAVIGKIHRLGLSPVRPPGAMARNCPPGARDPRAASQRRQLRLLWSDGAATRQAGAPPDTVESAAPCSLLDLAHGTCRWPVSDAAGNSGGAVSYSAATPQSKACPTARATPAWRTAHRRGGGLSPSPRYFTSR